MKKTLGLRAWTPADFPLTKSVPVTVIILTKNEAPNIERSLESAGWADQVVVVDCGSTDDTVTLAREAGAEIVEEPWRGFAAQREFALRHPTVRHEWVYFLDADEWVSDGLANEIAMVVRNPRYDSYAQRFRLVFMGRWIRHCGWYRGSWIIRLMRRSAVRFGTEMAGERVLTNSVGRMQNDIVDEDRKGLAAWLHKHVGYAELEVRQQGARQGVRLRWGAFRERLSTDSRPLPRAVAKDLIYPFVPAKPAALFIYMYVIRLGLLDGRPGLTFCLYHAWYRMTIEVMRYLDSGTRRSAGDSIQPSQTSGSDDDPGTGRGLRSRDRIGRMGRVA